MRFTFSPHHTETYRLFIAYVYAHAKDIKAALLVIAGCVIFGLMSLQIPVHKSYLRARIKTITLRYGSKKPGAMLFLETEDGRTAVVSTRLIHPDLKEGVELCLQELTDAIKGGRWFVHTTADRCFPAPVQPAY